MQIIPIGYLNLNAENPLSIYTPFGPFNLCPNKNFGQWITQIFEIFDWLYNEKQLTGVDSWQRGEIGGGGEKRKGGAGWRVGQEELELLLHSKIEPRGLCHFAISKFSALFFSGFVLVCGFLFIKGTLYHLQVLIFVFFLYN